LDTRARLATVMRRSAWGRRRLALASVVRIRPSENRALARLAMSSFSWAGPPPRRGPLVGVGIWLFLPQRQAELLELLADLVDRLGPGAAEGEEGCLALCDPLAPGPAGPGARVPGGQQPVGLDVQDQPVVVGHLARAGGLDGVADPAA